MPTMFSRRLRSATSVWMSVGREEREGEGADGPWRRERMLTPPSSSLMYDRNMSSIFSVRLRSATSVWMSVGMVTSGASWATVQTARSRVVKRVGNIMIPSAFRLLFGELVMVGRFDGRTTGERESSSAARSNGD